MDRYTAPGAATATVTTTTACFDGADRLLSTSSVAASAVGYDARGNTTRLGGSTLRFDGAGRNTALDDGSGTSVSYVRDAFDRIVQRSAAGTAATRSGR